MQIRRNYRNPFFRPKPKRGPWRLILVVLLVFGGMALFVYSQPQTIITAANSIMGNMPTPTPTHFDIAAEAANRYRLGDLTGAAALYQEAIAQRPDALPYMYELGHILLDDNRVDEAQAVVDEMLELSPGDVRTLALRARTLVWLGDSASAIPIALAALQNNPDYAPLHTVLARAYANTGEWRTGVDYGLEAITLGPDDVHTWWAYANALALIGATDQSMEALAQAIEVNPYFLPPYFELAILYLSSDRDQEAIDTYDRILGIQPRNARALLRQCQAYRKIGEFERALGLCQDAVTVDPTFAPAQYQLGLLRYNDREFAAARDAFQGCVEQDEGNLECTYRLGLAHYYQAKEDHQLYTTCSNPNEAENPACAGPAASDPIYTEGCNTAWDLLQGSLIMAQTQGLETGDAVDIIREGLTAIASDPICPDRRGSPLVEQAESTPEATPESTGDQG